MRLINQNAIRCVACRDNLITINSSGHHSLASLGLAKDDSGGRQIDHETNQKQSKANDE